MGALVYLAGRWVGLDLLAPPALFARVWPRLGAGYAADALGQASDPGFTPDPATLLATLARCPVEPAATVGVGRERRLGGGGLTGAVLVVDDAVAHRMAFPDFDDEAVGGR